MAGKGGSSKEGNRATVNARGAVRRLRASGQQVVGGGRGTANLTRGATKKELAAFAKPIGKVRKKEARGAKIGKKLARQIGGREAARRRRAGV